MVESIFARVLFSGRVPDKLSDIPESDTFVARFRMKIELVTNLKRNATRVLAKLARVREPLLITEHGRPKAYLVDVETYEATEAKLRLLEGIARGEQAILQGRTVSHSDAKQRLKRWL